MFILSLISFSFFRIVRQVVTETYENDDHFDITYIVIVWFAFLPTVIVPWFISHWLLIGTLKKVDRRTGLPLLNNGHQSEPRRHSFLRIPGGSVPGEANVSSISRPAVNETILVHDFPHQAAPRNSGSSRPNDHPTPGKMPKRTQHQPPPPHHRTKSDTNGTTSDEHKVYHAL